MKRIAALALATLTSASLWGCADAEIEPTQRVVEAAPDAVLSEAATILRREFGRIDVDPRGGRINTAPAEFRTASESGTARDLYGGQSQMRRVAVFSVVKRGDLTTASLRVDVERRDTQRALAFQQSGSRVSDTPGSDTAISRDAALTERQSNVWTRVRRDRRMERELLEELRDLFARRSADVPATAPAADAPAQPS